MAMSNDKINEIVRRIHQVRLKMINEHPFYAMLLMYLKIAIDYDTPKAYTDGTRIAFNPMYFESLSDEELMFILMHEVLHVVLNHTVCMENNDMKKMNIACDIVVNSNILYSNNMNLKSIYLNGKPLIHLTPTNQEGYLFTCFEVYKMLKDNTHDDHDDHKKHGDKDSEEFDDYDLNGVSSGIENTQDDKNYHKTNWGEYSEEFDDHSFWNSEIDDNEQSIWLERSINAMETVKKINELNQIPYGVERYIDDLLKSKIDWRTVLDNFIQEEINDYSFMPPDRRLQDNDFFLPDYNEKDINMKNVYFLVDTSGSMTKGTITLAYSEIKGAIQQFGGKMEGFIIFGDSVGYEKIPFDNTTDIESIIPIGGGGTDFEEVINYAIKNNLDNLPNCIIYITDGECPYPDESITLGIPFLWLLTKDNNDPPWGKVARITDEN